ncbi:peptidoglycan-binding protein [Rathayibacter tanaceti]|uniref:HlyD family efflux transporter periplasmic adaptor subunit n=2 Tax=Rathayibacter tanaceti TaxID=1671680 RepID=A0A166I159_9MICO|nr:peptidoglycan-binding protein [Rathayibacter tanaceti]KZX21466.1 putative peptidoglycan binding domain protein [Rathayibacter tanaceti]QHC54365.1 HlyD family efflux transporter periplasmic adaptor subunit [Rathayibacter tanaceti]TCO38048.1 HlyD family secretion protein [Rathayibacter tanaceti]
MSTRRRVIAGIVCAVLFVGGAAAVVTLVPAAGATQEEPRSSIPTGTAPITAGDLVGTTQVTGTLDYADQRKVGSGAGIVTSVPVPGSTVALGGALYTVDNVPVVLLHGPLPAWRPFASGMGDGPDVQQLEQSLAALGFFDRTPDKEFASSTERAIVRWQKALGVQQTGRLELGSVVFLPGDVRIASVDAAVGSPAAAEIVTVSSLVKRIEVQLKLADQRLGVVGAKVDVRLPGGGTTAGTVTDVGAPAETETNGQKTTTIPVGVALDDPTAAADLQRASVTVGFPTERRENVLSVPVEALIAVDDKSFGVEIVGEDGTRTTVPVTTGLFADGRVEVSGDGVRADLDVVVPAS